jgi:hypothetical protein
MCIVIDLNRIPSVLNPDASDHSEFKPILDWIDRRNARIVYGGKKYKTELLRMPKYFGVLLERKKAGQVYEADDGSVDAVEEQIKEKTQGTHFNDQAIVAIVIVSNCRFICSGDKKSHPFFKSRSLYPAHVKCPIIYSNGKHKALLNHRHVAGKCGPCCSSS